MSTTFRFTDGVDPWERQTGEPAEEFDWFTHWRNDGHRRSHQRTADRFETKVVRINRVAKQNQWSARLAAYRASNSAALQERFRDIVEQSLVPFAQGVARMAVHTVQADLTKVPADRAMLAVSTALRVIKEPDVAALIQVSNVNVAGSREIDLADFILSALAERFPEAHDLVLDAMDELVNGREPGQIEG